MYSLSLHSYGSQQCSTEFCTIGANQWQYIQVITVQLFQILHIPPKILLEFWNLKSKKLVAMVVS